MNQIEVCSFAAACIIVPTGFDPESVELLDNGMPVFYLDEAGDRLAQLQVVESVLGHLERSGAGAKGGTR